MIIKLVLLPKSKSFVHLLLPSFVSSSIVFRRRSIGRAYSSSGRLLARFLLHPILCSYMVLYSCSLPRRCGNTYIICYALPSLSRSSLIVRPLLSMHFITLFFIIILVLLSSFLSKKCCLELGPWGAVCSTVVRPRNAYLEMSYELSCRASICSVEVFIPLRKPRQGK